MDGINKDAELIKAFLIGQIGKNTAINPNPINLSIILDEAYASISEAKYLIGGRTIIVECDRIEKLIQHYKDHHFEILIDHQDDHQVTMFRFIDEA